MRFFVLTPQGILGHPKVGQPTTRVRACKGVDPERVAGCIAMRGEIAVDSSADARASMAGRSSWSAAAPPCLAS